MRRKSVPNSGPLAPPTVETSVIPTLDSSAPALAGRVSSSAATAAVMPLSMLDAVVGVTDRGVQLGQVVPVLGHERGEGPHPLVEDRRGHAFAQGQMPHLNAAVLTGASQSESSSSSTLSSVTDAPAMSREVM